MIHTIQSYYRSTDLLQPQQKTIELNRLRKGEDTKLIRHTDGATTWLTTLPQKEFQALLTKILPEIEQE